MTRSESEGRSILDSSARLSIRPPALFSPKLWDSFRDHCFALGRKALEQKTLTSDERIEALSCKAEAASAVSPAYGGAPGVSFWAFPVFPPDGWNAQEWFTFTRHCQDVLDKINGNQLFDDREFTEAHVCANFAWHGPYPANVQVPRWLFATIPRRNLNWRPRC